MTDKQDAEITWVRLTKRGDRAAFSYLVEQYQHPIYNLCYRMLNDQLEAEDAAQETFIRAFVKINTFDESRKFSSWLFSIASHYCLDQYKRRKLSLVSWDDLPGAGLAASQQSVASQARQPEHTLIANEEAAMVQTLLDTLPPAYRAAVILKYWHHLSCQEIAETLDSSVSAIKSKLFRARKMMAAVSTPQPTVSERSTRRGEPNGHLGRRSPYGVSMAA